MTLRVFAATGTAQPGHDLTLAPEESHYLVRVRRARAGRPLEVLDERTAFTAELVAADPVAAVVRVLAEAELPTPVPLRLGLGMPEPKATLEAITVACEAGATEVCLLATTHSHHASPSVERIERVVRAAMRQCGRPTAPTIDTARPLADFLAEDDPRPGFVACTRLRGEATPLVADDTGIGARLLVGPEAGLTDDEAAAATAAGFVPISLGPWVLRTPTAVSAGLGRLLARTMPSPG